jgi:hypothetical protein
MSTVTVDESSFFLQFPLKQLLPMPIAFLSTDY